MNEVLSSLKRFYFPPQLLLELICWLLRSTYVIRLKIPPLHWGFVFKSAECRCKPTLLCCRRPASLREYRISLHKKVQLILSLQYLLYLRFTKKIGFKIHDKTSCLIWMGRGGISRLRNQSDTYYDWRKQVDAIHVSSGSPGAMIPNCASNTPMPIWKIAPRPAGSDTWDEGPLWFPTFRWKNIGWSWVGFGKILSLISAKQKVSSKPSFRADTFWLDTYRQLASRHDGGHFAFQAP